jgi:hypothetical protein
MPSRTSRSGPAPHAGSEAGLRRDSVGLESPLYAALETPNGGIPMTKDELVASLALGAMATLTLVLVGGRRLVDLVPVWAFGG